jgi:hypothetical protein
LEDIIKVIYCPICGKKQKNLGKIIKCNCEQFKDKPKTEYLLFILQERFLNEGRSKQALSNMYSEIYLYTKKLLLNKLKGKRLLPPEQVEEKTLDATHKLFEYYLRSPDFKIEGSFAGYINQLLLGTLYNRKKKKEDSNYSLDIKINEKGDELSVNIVGFGYIDLFDEKNLVDEEFLKKSKDLINNIGYFLDTFSKSCQSQLGSLISHKILMGVNYLLEKRTDHFMDLYYDEVGKKIKEYIEYFYNFIYDYLLYHSHIENVKTYAEEKVLKMVANNGNDNLLINKINLPEVEKKIIFEFSPNEY